MFKNILVPLDGSDLAERAIPYACQLASSTGHVMLMRATQAHRTLHSSPTAEADAIGEAEHYLRDVSEHWQCPDSEMEWHTYYGPAAEAILDEVGMRRIDAIVMSTHGRGGLQRLMYGSVAEQVVHGAMVPVLLVPSRCERAWPPVSGAQVLVPLDGSEVAEAAIEPALMLAQRLHASLRLLRVVEPVKVSYLDMYGPLEAMREDDADTYMDRLVTRLQSRRLAVTGAVEYGSAGDIIASVAGSLPTGAVVMATHGRGGLARLVMGSVTARVLHHVTTPMLVVRPAAFARVAEPAPALQLAV